MRYSYVTDNTHTLDGADGCLPEAVTVTGIAVALDAPRICDVWLDGLTASATCRVEMSPDGVRWFSSDDITIGQTIVRVITTDAAQMRVVAVNSGPAAAVYAAIALAEWPKGVALIPGIYIMQGPYITRIG